MAITYKWDIVQLECLPSNGKQQNVVSKVHWNCIGRDGEYSGHLCGVVTLPEPSVDGFVNYNNLDKDIALQWCMDNGVEKDLVEANIADQINHKKTPPTVSPPLPWQIVDEQPSIQVVEESDTEEIVESEVVKEPVVQPTE